ncbi:TRAP transporter small permease [Minwuia thermotolerans]|uniref:TRAP transporter small permease protein n=1 Tax=Minwuia thermotolerans TaxID=2056226 RepID=A0A2M9G3Q6_9PROT|nr:TRAP transporter small permease [Minwuia thermotolerans]PJK30330.1 TRAP transporter small permease [Minwuia thermotolerans]
MTRRLGHWLRYLTSGLAIVADALVALMMLHIAFEVMMRYVFGISVPGTLTLVSKYYLPAVVFLPLAMAERRGNHISVEVLTQVMPRRVQKALEVFAWILATAVFATLAYQTLLDALKKTRIGAFELDFGYQFMTWPSYYVLPVGFAAIALVLLYKIAITLFRKPDHLGMETDDGPAEPAVSKRI